MNTKTLIKEYSSKKLELKSRIKQFSTLNKNQYYEELLFCILTPQSNAKKCWKAVEQLRSCSVTSTDLSLEKISTAKIQSCLKTNTRFYKNKTKYILELQKKWKNTEKMLCMVKKPLHLREKLVQNVKGLGMKEASHFLRNIGKSKNQLAILDRHILSSLLALKVIESIPNLNKKNYELLENSMKNYAKKIKIPLDELDLLLWSMKTGEIFK